MWSLCFAPNTILVLSLCIRHKQLESILVVTQQFHETLEPLSEWLSMTEKHLANSEPIGTETSKLEDQISKHKVMHSILSHYHMLVLFICIQFCSFCSQLWVCVCHYFPLHLISVSFFYVFSVCVMFPWFISHPVRSGLRGGDNESQ